MRQPADLEGNIATAMREHDFQRFQFIERATEHQVRNHQRGIEREAEQIIKIIVVHAAVGAALIGMRKHEAAELLDGAQHRTELFLGELRAVDAGGEFDRFETIFTHDAFEFGDRRVRVLHWQKSHAAQTRRMFINDLCDAVVDVARCGHRRFGLKVMQEHRRGCRQRGDLDAHGIHCRELGPGVVENRPQLGEAAAPFIKYFAVPVFNPHAVARGFGTQRIDEGQRNDMVVQIDDARCGHVEQTPRLALRRYCGLCLPIINAAVNTDFSATTVAIVVRRYWWLRVALRCTTSLYVAIRR